MNNLKLEAYLADYKKYFSKIHDEEIYKWKAVKTFQENWFRNDFENFNKKLFYSLQGTYNLMASGNYFARGVMLQVSEKYPKKVEKLFEDLFDETKNLQKRIQKFRTKFHKIHQKDNEGDKDYNDHRAVMVYLSLRYPNKYYLYKFTMFKNYSDNLELSVRPKRGKYENISSFMIACENLNYIISQDEELIRMHKSRLDESMYQDERLNILTQDVIYAISRNMEHALMKNKSKKAKTKSKISVARVSTISNSYVGVFNFKSFLNTEHEAKTKENSRIGFLGEVFVMNYLEAQSEDDQLNPIHVSIINGDGTGYDILGFTKQRDKMFIEVKTTRGSLNSLLSISRNELERSKKEKDNYYLFRVYNFNEDSLIGDILIIRGSLDSLCNQPSEYKVKI